MCSVLSLPLGLLQHSAPSKVLCLGVNKPRRGRLLKALPQPSAGKGITAESWLFPVALFTLPQPLNRGQTHSSTFCPSFQQHSFILLLEARKEKATPWGASRQGRVHALGSLKTPGKVTLPAGKAQGKMS